MAAFRQIIFVLHGIGAHTDGWEREFVDPLHEAYDQYPELKKTPIDERFKFVALGYDALLREIVQTWADNAAIIGKFDADLGKTVASKLVGWLKDAGELKDNPVWTHGVDVLLYRGIRLVREHVCTKIAAMMLKEITAQHQQFGRSSWSVVAHSLGTAVIHGTLARLTTPNDGWPGALAFQPEYEQANVVAMVANVSKVLELKTKAEPYDAYGHDEDGGVRHTLAPGFPGQSGRACRYYLNLRHKLDPITLPKMFAPQQWPDPGALAAVPPRYQYIELEHVHQVNTHDFAHYIRNPKAHVPLFRALVSPEHISPDEFEKKKLAFPEFGPIGHDAAVMARQKLLDLMPAVSDDWIAIIKAWKGLADLAGLKP